LSRERTGLSVIDFGKTQREFRKRGRTATAKRSGSAGTFPRCRASGTPETKTAQ
jgi:hypothetical protein